jgi:hypothetical protein
MKQIRWVEAEDHHESLAVSLRAVLAGSGTDRPYDELVAALGLGFATVATAADSLDWWSTYARDASLTTTAELYGLRLRELHPSSAALGLAASAEYAQHFRDSYLPLIARALEHNQLVLAWRGWPAPRDRFWGLITSLERETLFGYTLEAEGQPQPLVGPAHQIYIVEESPSPEPRALTAAHLFAHVARQAQAVWAGTWVKCANIETGAAAYRAWQNALQVRPNGVVRAVPLHRQQSQAARVHRAARSCLAAWLRRIGPALAADQAKLAAYWADTCDRVRQRLLPYEPAERVRELLDEPDGTASICRAIDEIREMEAGLVEKLAVIR